MKITDVLIIGCGIAGATAAIELARDAQRQITMLTRAEQASDSNSSYAQGGIVTRGEDGEIHRLLGGRDRHVREPEEGEQAERPEPDEFGVDQEEVAVLALLQGQARRPIVRPGDAVHPHPLPPPVEIAQHADRHGVGGIIDEAHGEGSPVPGKGGRRGRRGSRCRSAQAARPV